MKKRNRILSLLLAGAMALGLTACGASNAGAAADETGSAAKRRCGEGDPGAVWLVVQFFCNIIDQSGGGCVDGAAMIEHAVDRAAGHPRQFCDFPNGCHS